MSKKKRLKRRQIKNMDKDESSDLRRKPDTTVLSTIVIRHGTLQLVVALLQVSVL